MFNPYILSLYVTSILFISVLIIKKSLHVSTVKNSMTAWGLFGFLVNFITGSVYYVTLPFNTLPLAGYFSIAEFLLVTFVVLVFSLVVGILYSLIGAINIKIKNKSYLAKLFCITFSVIIIEILRAYALTIVFWGSGSIFGAHMSSWTFGEILALTPFASFAYFGGTFALSGMFIFILGLCVYPIKFLTKIIIFITLVIFAIGIRVYPQNKIDTAPITIAVVQTSFPSLVYGQSVSKVFKYRTDKIDPLVRELASTSPDIIVLPEDSRFITSRTTEEKEELRNLFPNTLFVDGTTRIIGGDRKNATLFFDSKTNETVLRDKGFLFPSGEYIPYIIKPIVRIFVGDEVLKKYESLSKYVPGVLPSSTQTRHGKVGTLICSELSSFSSVNSLRKSDPEIVFVQSSLTRGHNNPRLIMQHIFSVKILANTIRKPIISVANNGPVLVVDARGKTIFFKDIGLSTTMFILEGDDVRRVK